MHSILYFLRLGDALVAQQVNRAFFHAIQDSPRIQRKLGFLPHNDSHFRVILPLKPASIFLKVDYQSDLLDDHSDGLHVTEDNCVILSGNIIHGMRKLPKLGSRCRKLLISLPPVKALKVFADCCCSDRRPRTFSRELTYTITSDIGVTFGDLIHASRQYTKDHQLCLYASFTEHNENGMVNCSFDMQATVQLRDGDSGLQKKSYRKTRASM